MVFESDVISDGTQTPFGATGEFKLFESDVISDGTQTRGRGIKRLRQFESDVISGGIFKEQLYATFNSTFHHGTNFCCRPYYAHFSHVCLCC